MAGPIVNIAHCGDFGVRALCNTLHKLKTAPTGGINNLHLNYQQC